MENCTLAAEDPKQQGFMELLGVYNLGVYSLRSTGLGLPLLDLIDHWTEGLQFWGSRLWVSTVLGV